MKVNGSVLEEGCYGDGGLGQDHIRQVLADMVRGVSPMIALILERSPQPSYEEEFEALEALNDVTEGGYWVLDQGDLFLVEEGSDLDACLMGGGNVYT